MDKIIKSLMTIVLTIYFATNAFAAESFEKLRTHRNQNTKIAALPSLNPMASEQRHHRMYGKDAAFQLADLPAKSRLRQQIEALPETEQHLALKHLHDFSFPENDIDELHINNQGDVYYRDEAAPAPALVSQEQASNSTLIALPKVSVFKLHSRPQAKNKVFLDFNGHTIRNTVWNDTVPNYEAVAFDIDGNPNTFSANERNRIAEIWHRIAEDYAPFNIDVTTEQPKVFGPTVGRIVFTKDVDAQGLAMPAQGASGIAYVNVFGNSNYASYYSPALVYYNKLGPGFAPYMAEAGAHEFGHNLGLSHDGISNGADNLKCINTTSYYCGTGNSQISWAPIMGGSYDNSVTQWSKGEYANATNTQDDLSIISSKLKYRPDDHSNSFINATALIVESDGSIVVSNPQNDPANVENVNKGIIEKRTDRDVFWFDANGAISIKVTPAWAAFYRKTGRGANLDIQATLYDESGNKIAVSNPTTDTYAKISTTVNAGRYYLLIDGVGSRITPYSDYGSLGEYFISGSVSR